MQRREQSSTEDLGSTTDATPTIDSKSVIASVSTTSATSATTSSPATSFTATTASSSTTSATSTSIATSASGSGYNFASGGGLAVTLILLFFILGVGAYFGYILYLQYKRRHSDMPGVDQEKLLSEARLRKFNKAQPQDMSKKGPTSFDDIVTLDGKVLDRSSTASKASDSLTASPDDVPVRHHHQQEGMHPAETTPRSLNSIFPRTPQQVRPHPGTRPRRPTNLNLNSPTSSPKSPITRSSTDQWLSPPPPIATRPRASQSTPLPSPSLPTSPPVPQRSPVRPTRPPRLSLLGVNRYTPQNSSRLSGRSLPPKASSAELMNHPAVKGRRLSDLSPGLDPDYAYPMTPGQIGDGRSLEGLGRYGGGDTVGRRVSGEARRPV